MASAASRLRNPGGDFLAAFRWRRKDQVGGSDGRHLDVEIDAVKQRARQPRLILGGTAYVRSATAGEAGIAGAAAAAGIHRRHQHEARRIGDAVIGSRNRDFSGLQRLPQRIEHRALEFGELVEKQHAAMRERHFARPRAQSATDQGRHRRGMMR